MFQGPLWWSLKTPRYLSLLADAAEVKATVEGAPVGALAATLLQAPLTLPAQLNVGNATGKDTSERTVFTRTSPGMRSIPPVERRTRKCIGASEAESSNRSPTAKLARGGALMTPEVICLVQRMRSLSRSKRTGLQLHRPLPVATPEATEEAGGMVSAKSPSPRLPRQHKKKKKRRSQYTLTLTSSHKLMTVTLMTSVPWPSRPGTSDSGASCAGSYFG